MAAGVVVMMMMILISTFWMKIFWTWRLAVTSLSEQSALTCFLWLHQVSLKVLTDKNLICFRNEKILNFNEKRKTNFKKYSWETWPSYRRKHKIRKKLIEVSRPVLPISTSWRWQSAGLMKTFFSETNFLTNVFVMYVALRTVTFTAYTHLSLLLLTRLESSIWIKIKIPSSTLLCPTIAMHHEIIGNVSQIWPNCNMCIGDWAHSSLTVNICVIVACTPDYLKVHSLIGAVRRREGDSASQCFSPSVRDHYQAPSHYPY